MATNEEVEQARKDLEAKRERLTALHDERRQAEVNAENDVTLAAIAREAAAVDAAIKTAEQEASTVAPAVPASIKERAAVAAAQEASAPATTAAAASAEARADEARHTDREGK